VKFGQASGTRVDRPTAIADVITAERSNVSSIKADTIISGDSRILSA